MMGFAIAALIVAAVVALVWLALKAADGSVLAGPAAIGLAIVILGLVAISVSIKEGERGPRHQHETRMMYSAATKTMMPSRACILRGEWVEEGHENQ